MSRQDKLLERFLSRPKDFTFAELESLLRGFGYVMKTGGRTGGSRVAFYHPETLHIIRLHRPHPRPILRCFQLDDIRLSLKSKGRIP